jgi:soluble lytic murein transglycosylase-like protein
MLRRLALVAALLLVAAVPAGAQIFSWRDANGNLVLSDRPATEAGRAYDVGRRRSQPSDRQTGLAAATTARYRATRQATTTYNGSYDALIQRHATSYGVSPDLVRAVIQVESAFDAQAQSAAGAQGLMQLMPATAAEMGVDDPFDAGENIRGGTAYLRQLLDRYDGDVTLALAAYNAGPEAVERHGRQVPPFPETQQYVSRVKARSGASGTPSRIIYKIIEIIDGRPVPRYTDTKPESGFYEVVRTKGPSDQD